MCLFFSLIALLAGYAFITSDVDTVYLFFKYWSNKVMLFLLSLDRFKFVSSFYKTNIEYSSNGISVLTLVIDPSNNPYSDSLFSLIGYK